jgi:mono/diheme cytochrome c family protein
MGSKMLKKTSMLAAFLSLVFMGLVSFTQNSRAAAKGDAKAAMDIFTKNCQRCHGDHGKGDGPAGKFLKTKPADWTDKARMSKLTEADLKTVITKGGAGVGKSPVMPAFADKLKDQDVDNLIALIHQMGGEK